MENKEINKLSIVVTDRLNETKTIETKLDVSKSDKKVFNKALIGKLKEFQDETNNLMTSFVNKEKQALDEKKLSNDYLKNNAIKKIDKVASDDEASGSSDDEESVKAKGDETKDKDDKSHVKRGTEENDKSLIEPIEKKLCVDSDN